MPAPVKTRRANRPDGGTRERLSQDRLEDEEALARQEGVVVRQAIAGRLELPADRVAGGGVAEEAREETRVAAVLDDGQAPARAQPLAQPREIRRAIRQVMVRIAREHEVDRLRQSG